VLDPSAYPVQEMTDAQGQFSLSVEAA